VKNESLTHSQFFHFLFLEQVLTFILEAFTFKGGDDFLIDLLLVVVVLLTAGD
jgi:hypothetical protein